MTIRRTPQDFRVEERQTPEFHASIVTDPLPSHPFAAYTLEKISLATPDALTFISKTLKLPRECVAAAGLKDRHAVTTQVITIDTAAVKGRVRERFETESWRLTHIGFVPRAADSTIIARNAFTIVVRSLDKWHADELVRRASLMRDHEGNLLFVNYFGDQRFGSARHGKGFVGKALVEGEFEQALRLAIGTPARKDSGAVRSLTRALATHWGDWKTALKHFPKMPERAAIETLARGGNFMDAFAALPKFTQEICIEAYQSHIWNAIARELAHAVSEATAQRAFEADDLFGTMVFPRAAAITPAFRAFPIPMPSPRAQYHECLAEIVAGVLEDEGVTLETLRIPGFSRPFFGGGDRAFIATARAASIGEPVRDEFAGNSPANLACTLSFELPRGSYATVLLRALGQ
ncbi:MAG: tRNA pseudouridine(13) synthase TruD [bacterium]